MAKVNNTHRHGRKNWLFLFSLLFATGHAMACDKPSFDLDIPEGQSASESEMAQAQKAVQDFVAAGEEYVSCLEDDGDMNSSRIDRLADETIAEMQKVAALFNRQLLQFKRNN